MKMRPTEAAQMPVSRLYLAYISPISRLEDAPHRGGADARAGVAAGRRVVRGVGGVGYARRDLEHERMLGLVLKG